MAKTVIIDGYNVIHKIPRLSEKLDDNLEAARSSLKRFMEAWKRSRNFRGSVYIVFDSRGSSPFANMSSEVSGLCSIFSKDADECIIGMVKNARDTSDVLVISADNRVRNHCKAYAVDVEYPEFLLGGRRTEVEKEEEKRLDMGTIFEINEFVKKAWKVE
jgi:predicted RNA-binding protein with PIN domain